MKRTWRMRLDQVRVLMTHGAGGKDVGRAGYKVELTAVLHGSERTYPGPDRGVSTTMTAAQARSLARVLNDMADAVDTQNLHAGYRVAVGTEGKA